MANPLIAQRIAQQLREGSLTHPGNPDTGVPPKPLMMAAFRSAGMPQQQAELVNKTVDLIGEAIVAAIEETHDIVPHGEVAIMQAAVDENPPKRRTISVHCRCDRRREDPLMMITVDAVEPMVVISGKQLLEGLAHRESACPHREKGK